jgi:putative oxidoreductase
MIVLDNDSIGDVAMAGVSRARPWFATVLLWIGTAILFVLFLAGGIQKLTQETSALRDFSHWQYPLWFMLVVGAVELSCAILVVIPPVAFAGASLIAIDMIGGVVTTLRFGQYDRALLSLILLAISLVVARARWSGFWGRSSRLSRRSLPMTRTHNPTLGSLSE